MKKLITVVLILMSMSSFALTPKEKAYNVGFNFKIMNMYENRCEAMSFHGYVMFFKEQQIVHKYIAQHKELASMARGARDARDAMKNASCAGLKRWMTRVGALEEYY